MPTSNYDRGHNGYRNHNSGSDKVKSETLHLLIRESIGGGESTVFAKIHLDCDGGYAQAAGGGAEASLSAFNT